MKTTTPELEAIVLCVQEDRELFRLIYLHNNKWYNIAHGFTATRQLLERGVEVGAAAYAAAGDGRGCRRVLERRRFNVSPEGRARGTWREGRRRHGAISFLPETRTGRGNGFLRARGHPPGGGGFRRACNPRVPAESAEPLLSLQEGTLHQDS